MFYLLDLCFQLLAVFLGSALAPFFWYAQSPDCRVPFWIMLHLQAQSEIARSIASPWEVGALDNRHSRQHIDEYLDPIWRESSCAVLIQEL